jgi:hypothetical protein
MKSVSLSMLAALVTLVVAPALRGQTTLHLAQAPRGRVEVPRVQLHLPQLAANSSNIRVAGFPIFSSATTKSGRFRQLFGDRESIPVRWTESSDLTPTERSKITRSKISCP